MSCKSAIYAVNPASQILDAEEGINFGQAIRRFGCHTRTEGGNLLLRGSGYYSVDSNITLTPAAAGPVTVTFYKDGVEIPGATATASVALNAYVQLSIPFIVRNTCDCDSVIVARVSAGATITNAAIDAEKI